MTNSSISPRLSACAGLLAACLAMPMVASAATDSAATAPTTATNGPHDAAANSAGDAPASHSQTFAVVNGHSIPTQEYETAFSSLVRQKFYHGQVPDKEIAAAREEVKTRLVQRVVLLDEATKRGITPDAEQIDSVIAGYESRYANSAAWRENRERLLPGLRKQLEEQSLVARLESQTRSVADPTDQDVRAFFAAKPSLFTEPEKLRLSVILLTVDPSSPATAWQATRDEAQAIYQRLMTGADFGDAARMHSGAYADAGGNMGYLHRGMLPEALQERIDAYEIGKINAPIETLQGMAIFRLDERVPAKSRSFDEVASRARDLLIRERQDQAWKSLVENLVATAEVRFLHGVTPGQGDSGRK